MPLEPTTLESFIKQRFEGWLTKPLTPEDEAAMHLKSVDHLALYRSEEVREAFYAHNVKLIAPDPGDAALPLHDRARHREQPKAGT